MALEPLCFHCLLFIFLGLNKFISGQNFDVETLLSDTTFDCALDIEGTTWSMECDSNNFDFKSSTKFITSQLRGSLDDNKPLLFKDIISSISFNDSQFNLCDSEWRYFILRDKSMLASNCVMRKKLKRLINSLDESSLIKIEISHSETPILMLNILENCSRLQEIIITQNSIQSLHLLPVSYNNTIKNLNLKENFIRIVDDGLLTEFHNLESLDISHNLLSSISNILFSETIRIVSLDLSYNNIKYISEDAFQNLSALEYISLRNNKLEKINANIFKFNDILRIIDISNNDLKNLPSTLFHNMHNLKNVSCSNCSLFHLGKDIFKNSSNLAWFVATRNNIRHIYSDTFKDLNFLEVLDLSNNNISYFNGSLFSNHPYLMYVNVSNNIIVDISIDVFRGARNVRYLDFSANRIKTNITDDYFRNFTDIEILRLHHNVITSVELGIARPVRIRKLDISYNFVTNLNVRWKQLILIEIFNLNNNLLSSIDLPPCIPNMKQTLTFTFQHNRISKVNMDALIFDEHRVKNDRTITCFVNGLARNYVDLTNNPLVCDCKMYPFYKYIRENSTHRRYQIEIFIDKENITCEKPDYLRNQTLISLSDDMLSCPLNRNCPKSCYCGTRGKDNSVLMNCSSRSLQEVPEIHPQKTVVLYFNKNLLKSVKSLNNNAWNDLIELHLDFNFLKTLDDWEFPASLRYLSVKNNQLKTLPHSLMQFISNLTYFQLFFGNNDFNCDCDRKSFKNFLRENIDFVKDNDNILCNLTNNNNTFELLPLTSVFDNVLCSQDANSFKQMRVIIFLCVFFSVLIVTLLTYNRQRQLIFSYFYVHCRGLYDFFYADAVDDDAIFDAFVAYSSNDRAIVMELLEELENNPPYFQLCIHERNWLPGRFITDNIADSVENSRRTIIILSSTFLSSPWFNVELRAAVCKMAQDAINRIIVVLTDKNVSFDSIEPELRCVISKRTYLEWGERWFWEKLKYALPRKSITETKSSNQLEGSISTLALIPYKNSDENISD